jgi:hypothetical protein
METNCKINQTHRVTTMKLSRIFGFILIMYLWAPMVHGDIYSWTDQHGIVHYTNYAPPPQAKVVIRDVKMSSSHSGVTKAEETEDEGQESLELKLQGVNRRVEALEDSLEEAEALTEDLEEKLLTANKKAEEAIESAEALANETNEAGAQYASDVIYLNVRSYSPVYYPYRSYYKGHRLKTYHRGSRHKSHLSKKHLKTHHRGSHKKYSSNGRHFSKPHNAGIRQKGHFGARHFKKPHSGFRHNYRSSGRHFRR